jgi:hypothetical protein
MGMSVDTAASIGVVAKHEHEEEHNEDQAPARQREDRISVDLRIHHDALNRPRGSVISGQATRQHDSATAAPMKDGEGDQAGHERARDSD